MPKKIIQRFMPDHQKIKDNKHLKMFGALLHNANLWHLNRRSVSKAFAVGLFFAFMPVPFQMVLAAGFAIIVHANLPLSITLVWITNPLTMPAIFYFCYVVGTWIVDVPTRKFAFEANWQWLIDSVSTIGPAFIVGCGVLAAVFALLGYLTINIIWRFSVAKEWKKRKARRSQATPSS
ncbi:DUF2062 domain-containing protein [Colwellia sp. MB3u-70]|uniref:DUF2062 domain-containing protein n=1 Tax=unclassified Colwellia TaxID=196834 RepID=UPI0015F633F9|nr:MULTISPECIES: DUF2062 domain-containing protein [unclassified Colwellia]MBA6292470.1 DUF2062 domain-containing protein [Colwellia sp. MB3u-8]MBA6308681.1 DUF2062 domain-containing protein [Colwellia sp. MB3u-70]